MYFLFDFLEIMLKCAQHLKGNLIAGQVARFERRNHLAVRVNGSPQHYITCTIQYVLISVGSDLFCMYNVSYWNF